MPINTITNRLFSFRERHMFPGGPSGTTASTPTTRLVRPSVGLKVGTGVANNATVSTNAAAGATVRGGATWTHIRPAASMDSVLAVHDMQHQFMCEFGAGEVFPTQASFTNNTPTWSALDPFVQDIRDAGATQRGIVLGMAPNWMRRTPGNNESRMDVSLFDEYATMCARVAQRYTDVQWFPVWSECKDFYDNANNHYDWILFTQFYNQIYNAVKAVRPTAKVGGPYLICESGSGSWSHGPSAVTFNGGSIDSRVLSFMTYFRDNAVGYDFLCFDGGVENNHNTPLPSNPSLQISKFSEFYKWIRNNIHSTTPLLWIETYVNEAKNAPWNFTKAQRETLMIDMYRMVRDNVPNATNIWYLNWLHPLFLPQVVNVTNQDTGSAGWANTESTYRAALATWHGASTPSNPDLLTIFQTRYPATGAEIWVDGIGNDANSGSSLAPKQTIQGAINASVAGSKIMVRPGTYATHEFAGHSGTASNWIQMIAPSGGVKILANGGAGAISSATSMHGGVHHVAIYGFEYEGLNSSSASFECGVTMSHGSHTIAVWKCYFHDLASHAFAAPGAGGQGFSGCDSVDFCYNRVTKCCRWNGLLTSGVSQASGFSFIQQANIGTTWADGYRNHIIGNVIDGCYVDDAAQSAQFGQTDGNGIIFDVSPGYTGSTLCAFNLTVGNGGRGLHTLDTDNVHMWLNTSCDNSLNLDGTWIGEISITDSTACSARWNVGAARVGSNRVGIFQNPGTSVWSDTVFLRGTGGSESNDPSVNSFNNINKTSTGPSGFFTQYQQGSLGQTVITNIGGFRPTAAQVVKFTPSTTVRNALGAWPDALGVLRPASGDWAYGAFEAA